MSVGLVTRGNNKERPSWKYPIRNNGSMHNLDLLEMLESIRNVLESIHASQMLQCDVAGSIKRQEFILQDIRSLLKRKRKTRRKK